MLIVSSLVLAGCAGMSEDDAKEIAEELVDIPGCNDEAAYNYDENATNANACYTEAILKNTVADFILFLDQGPAWGETGGLTTEGSEVDEDGEMTTFSTTMAMSPDGIYVMTEMNMGMMQFSMGELVTENSENGKTNIQSTWMGSTFMMHSDATFAEHWNEVSFNENKADSDDDSDSEDDMEMGDDEMDMGMPDTEVDIPEDFDPATALYEAGLATDNGYSFTTTMDHGEGYSTTMTFTLSSMFEVTKVILEETDSEGMVSTSSITVLTAAEVDALLVDDENLVQHALPFVLDPMEPMMDMVCYDMNSHQIMMQIDNQDDCENGGYMWVPANSGPGGDGDGHNHGGDGDGDGDGHDHGGDGDGDGDGHNHGGDGDGDGDGHDHGGDGDGHDDGHDHGGHDHGPTFICGNGDEIPFEYVNDGEEDCTDGADEQQYDADGNEINWFDCMDGSQIWISQVNDGNYDCSDGDDEMPGDDDDHMGPSNYDNCAESDQGLSTLDCWNDDWDLDGDGEQDYDHGYWNYECQQLADGSWECMTDHINYYDNCAYEGENYYECWLDEWDTDNDGAYDLGSDGYMDYECELLEDGRWACSPSEDMDMYQVYDQCSDATGDYECWMNDWVDSEGNVVMTDGYPLGDCTQLEDGTWECLVMEDDDEIDWPSEEDFFSGADADNDGYVSAQDIVDFLLSGSFNAENALSDADSDGSGGISWEEFVADYNEDEDVNDPEDDHLDNNPQLESDLHAAFNASDTNTDGELSIDELESFIDQVFDLTADQDDISDITVAYTMLVNCIDTDGDSLLDQMEFSDFYMTITGDDDDNGMLVFCMFDADGDGQITDSEYTDYLNGTEYDNGGEPMTEAEWEAFVMMFNNYDIDESGGLDFTEFETMIMDGDDGDGPDMVCYDMNNHQVIMEIDNQEDCENNGYMWVHNDFGDGHDDGHDEYESELPTDEMEFINLLDADGSGGISYTEYLQFIEDSIGPMTEEQLAYWTVDAPEMFGDVDADGSGEVEQGEEYYIMIQELDMIFGAVHYYGLDDVREFICNDGQVIPIEYFNDGVADCADGSDEPHDHNNGGDGDGPDMVCYDMDSHQVMMEIDNQEDCENGGYMWVPANSGSGGDGDGDGDGHGHGGDGDGDGDGHDHGGEMMAPLDWGIDTADMMTDVSMIEGAFDDYSIVLALCTMDEDSMDEEDMMMGAPSMTCGDDVLKISIADAMMEGASVGFHDADASGTITSGDMIHVSPDYEADQPWNTVRLHSTSADKYSDENPMLPGFGVVAGLVALISAAMIARRD